MEMLFKHTLWKFVCYLFIFQYSQKEDKYEEEIKVLTDKLKEVKFFQSSFIIIIFVVYLWFME